MTAQTHLFLVNSPVVMLSHGSKLKLNNWTNFLYLYTSWIRYSLKTTKDIFIPMATYFRQSKCMCIIL